MTTTGAPVLLLGGGAVSAAILLVLLVCACVLALTTFVRVWYLKGLFTILRFSQGLRVAQPEEKKYFTASSPHEPLPLPSLTDEATLDLSVVIPAFNESKRLPNMLKTALTHMSFTKHKYEVLIVDDGSRDKTVATALSLAKENRKLDIRIVKLVSNSGKGAAVRHGMLHARGRRLLMVDADGASRFSDLELLWEGMDEIKPPSDASIAVGSRAHLVKTDAVVKRSFLRNILMYGFHFVLQTLGVGYIRDTQCGFKLFSRAAAQQLFPMQHLTNWVFDVELLLMAKQLRIPVAEIPIAWEEVDGSKLNVVHDSIGMLKDLIVLRINMLLGRWGAYSHPKSD